MLLIFQVGDAKQKRRKGLFGKQGGDKEVVSHRHNVALSFVTFYVLKIWN